MAKHPDFVRFSTTYRAGQYDQALALVEGLFAHYPDAPELHWHRANCLEQLERYAEINPELELLLARRPDYVPALVKRVRYAQVDADGADDGGASSDNERKRQASRHAEAELRRALALDASHVDALQLLSEVLRDRDDGTAATAEADALLDRAIELAPRRADLFEARAHLRRAAAMRDDGQSDDADTITTFNGMRQSRAKLEAALADFETCQALTGESRYAVRAAMVLHDLGRYDQALAHYDQALATMAADDPKRDFIVQTRARSENQGAGEREQMARLLETALLGDGKNRDIAEDMAAQALLGAANAIRAGKSVSEALESRLSEDPQVQLANTIAQQILNVAFEPPPDLSAAEAKDYPAFQRRFLASVSKQIAPLGLHHVGDAEARGLFMILSQHVLLRFFADDSGEVGVAAFAMKPKWPGWLGYLFMRLTGKWKVASMVECVTQFDDGTHISTQHENPSAFEHGGQILLEKLPRKTPVRELVARHLQRVAAFKAEHPGSVAMSALDIAGMDRRWREGQRVKRDYRRALGYATDTELQRILGAHYAQLGDKVRQQLTVLAADMVDP